jgi:Ca2+-binding RTX toxin-like protein
MRHQSRGGSDTVYGGDEGDRVIGDGYEMHGSSTGGSDQIYGGAGNDALWGDATSLSDDSVGGNDELWGGDDYDIIYGDAALGASTAKGGGDKLHGEGGNDELYGDFAASFGNTHPAGADGHDWLDGGTGNDILCGGGGNDVFAFGQFSGVDWIFDFKNSGGEQDMIDVSAYGISSFNALTINDDTKVHPHDGQPTQVAIIELSPLDQIIVAGVNAQDLSAADFIFSL